MELLELEKLRCHWSFISGGKMTLVNVEPSDLGLIKPDVMFTTSNAVYEVKGFKIHLDEGIWDIELERVEYTNP